MAGSQDYANRILKSRDERIINSCPTSQKPLLISLPLLSFTAFETVSYKEYISFWLQVNSIGYGPLTLVYNEVSNPEFDSDGVYSKTAVCISVYVVFPPGHTNTVPPQYIWMYISFVFTVHRRMWSVGLGLPSWLLYGFFRVCLFSFISPPLFPFLVFPFVRWMHAFVLHSFC